MRYGRLLTCLLFFWSCFLTAEEPSSLSATDPSLVVAGVSLLTGFPIMETTDLVLPGVDGVAFQRHFECFSSSRTGGWEPLPQLTLRIHMENLRMDVSAVDDAGHPIFFRLTGKNWKDVRTIVLPGTNNAGAFSARQSPWKHQMSWLEEGEGYSSIELTLANGTIRKYYCENAFDKLWKTDDASFHLLKETYPTGNSLECSYDNQGHLSAITTYDRAGEKITTAKIKKTSFRGPNGPWQGVTALECFKPMHDMSRREDYSFQVQLEDGRSLRYGLGAYSPPVKGPSPLWFLPVVVEGFGRPTEVLEYAFERRKVKELGEKERVPVAISKYSYADGSYRRYERDAQGRVIKVIVPDADGKESVLYRFQWEKSGDVEVEDCHHTRRCVHFDERKCPIAAEFYLADQYLGRQQWIWMGGLAPSLIATVVAQGPLNAEEILRVDEYIYERGNLTQHRVHGPYSGNPVHWNRNGEFPTCIECTETSYEYNDRHLITRQNEPGGRFQVFEWDPDRVLCTAHFIGVGGHPLQRTFNFYDDAANLIRVVEDNGSSMQIDDWTDVTHRQETLLELNQAVIGHHLPLKKTVCSLFQDGSSKLLYEERFEYDRSGQPTLCHHYDELGQLLWSKTAEYQNGLKVAECSQAGGLFGWSYDTLHRLVEERGPCGERSRYEYGRDGFCSKEHRWDGEQDLTTHRRCHPDGRLFWERSPEGWTSLYTYGTMGRCIQVLSLRDLTPKTAPGGRRTLRPQYSGEETAYDLLGRVISKSRGEERFSYRYGVHDLPFEERLPDKTRRRWKRDSWGQVTQVIEPDGTLTRYARDAMGRVFQEGREGQVTKRSYHQDQLTEEVDPLGHVTRYGYDASGRLLTMDREGQVTKLLYDSDGRPCGNLRAGLEDRSRLNAAGDPIERLVSYEGELQRQESWDLDTKGRKLAHRIWDGEREAISQWTYDLLDRVTSQTDPMGICIQTRYRLEQAPHDDLYYAQVREQIHPNGLVIQETSFFCNALVYARSARHGEQVLWEEKCAYDPLDRLIAVRRTCSDVPDQLFEWSYLPGGKLEVERHRALQESLETRYSYNKLGQLSRKDLPNGHWLQYQYDAMGRITETTSSDPTCQQKVTYDVLNRPIEVTTPAGLERTVYDTWGNVAREELSNGLVLQHHYDELNQRIATELPTGLTFSWSFAGQALRRVGVHSSRGRPLYDASVEMDLCGRVRALHSPYGSTHWDYDLCNRLQKIVHPEWAGEVMSYTERGQIADRKMNGLTAHVQYDELGHLTSEEGDSTQRFELNGFGQRTSVNGESCKLNPFGHPLTQGEIRLQWSRDGKLEHLSSPSQDVDCQWDALGRLKGLSYDRQKQSFQYDSLQRCIKRTIENTEQLHIFTGRHHLGVLQDGKLTARLLLPGVCETGCVIAVIEDEEVRETLCDLQGSVIWVEGVGATSYDAFGKSKKQLCPWGYRAKWALPELQWYDFGRRIYAPELGIFIGPDPKGLQEGWWAHHYCQHAPLGMMDAWGENAMMCAAQLAKAALTPIHMGLGQKAICYLCSPYRCQWPEAMDRFITSSGPKRLYFISTGVDNTVEEHLQVLKLVSACQPDDNFLIVGIYRPKDYNVISRFFYAADEGFTWTRVNPTSEGIMDFVSGFLQRANKVGGKDVFDRDFNMWVLAHSAGANVMNEVAKGIEGMGALGSAYGLAVAGASPIVRKRENGEWAGVHHIYTDGDPVAMLGGFLRWTAMSTGLDCGTSEWIQAAPGDSAHALFSKHHLDAAGRHLGLPLSLDRLGGGGPHPISRDS